MLAVVVAGDDSSEARVAKPYTQSASKFCELTDDPMTQDVAA
jgi:hypothetical protein